MSATTTPNARQKCTAGDEMGSGMESNLTVDSLLISSTHDRERREERDINKSDLQRARRYGMMEPGKHRSSSKYTYAGHVFIYDELRKKAITSWKIAKKASSGTAHVNPVLLQKSDAHDGIWAKRQHGLLRTKLMENKHTWRSHSVLVVDMSGSMRTDDVNGARCRSDGVWLVLARDFVRKQLDEGSTSMYDVVSVILMGDEARIALSMEPVDWVLYNKLVDLREWTTERPKGGGNYLPALELAENVLGFNESGGCALSLLFFSDGKPTDGGNARDKIYNAMGNMASRFGRRLTVSCVGMANGDQDFSVLERMSYEAESYGCPSAFQRPALSTDSLSTIISTLTSSISSTKSELTELRTGKVRTVRSDVVRERRNQEKSEENHPGSDWRVFGSGLPTDRMYTVNVYTWHAHHRDFATIMDPRCMGCFGFVADTEYNLIPGRGTLCPECKACYMCYTCSATQAHDCETLKIARRNGLLTKRHLPSFSVAWKKSAFGEGAERLAFKFGFVGEKSRFVGPKMVAKESRFVETKDDGTVKYLLSHRHSYHKTFMETQSVAAYYAGVYNETLDALLENVDSKQASRVIKKYPRIRFVDPMIFELAEDFDDGSQEVYNILVEPLIEGKYQKWNNNDGAVVDQEPPSRESIEALDTMSLNSDSIQFLLGRNDKKPDAELGAIVEEDESEEEESSLDEPAIDDVLTSQAGLEKPLRTYSYIPPEDFAQAFSHFSYWRSGGRLMVVDLQGSLQCNEDTVEFLLTDPAIHKRCGYSNLRHFNFGRTDRVSRREMRCILS